MVVVQVALPEDKSLIGVIPGADIVAGAEVLEHIKVAVAIAVAVELDRAGSPAGVVVELGRANNLAEVLASEVDLGMTDIPVEAAIADLDRADSLVVELAAVGVDQEMANSLVVELVVVVADLDRADRLVVELVAAVADLGKANSPVVELVAAIADKMVVGDYYMAGQVAAVVDIDR